MLLKRPLTTFSGVIAATALALPAGQFQNPILAGLYPAPSITRAGDFYYLVYSSFSYSPGVPVFRSLELVSWESLGHILTAPEQLPLENQRFTRNETIH